jgi:hypothetical protein
MGMEPGISDHFHIRRTEKCYLFPYFYMGPSEITGDCLDYKSFSRPIHGCPNVREFKTFLLKRKSMNFGNRFPPLVQLPALEYRCCEYEFSYIFMSLVNFTVRLMIRTQIFHQGDHCSRCCLPIRIPWNKFSCGSCISVWQSCQSYVH